jgi:predicted kinase
MPNLKIFTGNIGCGKSTLAARFARQFNDVVVNMDSIQQMIGGGEYGRYDTAKKDVYQATETAAIESALNAGLSVVIDRTNMDKKRRARFIEIGKKHAANIISYNWNPSMASSENGMLRRLKIPHGIPAEVWKSVFSFMQKNYEPISEDEGFDDVIVAPQKYKFYAFDFDGTIVTNKFPEIGEIIDGTVDKMNKIWEDIANVIIINTCRSGDYENLCRKFCLDNKIPFDFINENPLFETGSRKVFAHEYYDDRNKCVRG